MTSGTLHSAPSPPMISGLRLHALRYAAPVRHAGAVDLQQVALLGQAFPGAAEGGEEVVALAGIVSLDLVQEGADRIVDRRELDLEAGVLLELGPVGQGDGGDAHDADDVVGGLRPAQRAW